MTAVRIVLVLCLAFPLTVSAAEPELRPPPPAPVPAATLEVGIRRGVEFLMRTQTKEGAWGGPQWTGGVDKDPIPGAHNSFTTATTAMCVEALLAVGGDSTDVRHAIDRGTDYLLRELPRLRRADPGNLPNVWGHSFGIQTLVALHRLTPSTDTGRRALLEKHVREQIAFLAHFETVSGGWFYYASGLQKPDAPSCSFVNASVLVALHRARQLGVPLPEKVVDRAERMTKLMRNPDFSYIYSVNSPLKVRAAAPINRPSGSLGRSQACNYALRLCGDSAVTDDVMKAWLDRLVSRQGWLDMGRKKPIPHESFAQVAGYFYYFGHYYAGLSIGELKPAHRRFYQDHLARIILDRQEPEGYWFDYPLYSYHKPYGTAFALMTLGCCRKQP
jgi:hypothetical protein